MQVKGNQAQLLDDCRVVVAHEEPVDIFVAAPESGHGRIDHRSCRVFDCAYTTDAEWQPLIAQIVEVRRCREWLDRKTKAWKRSEEIAFYVSTTCRDAAAYHAIIRGHWGSENRNHYVRDVSMAEDASRIRKNPGIMARFRSFALNILRANGVENIAAAMFENALNLQKLKHLQYLWT